MGPRDIHEGDILARTSNQSLAGDIWTSVCDDTLSLAVLCRIVSILAGEKVYPMPCLSFHEEELPA